MRRLTAIYLILALVISGGAIASSQTVLPGLFGGPFALTDHNGRSVTEKSFAGRHMLVYFGYTYCPDICPTDLTSAAAALDQLGALADRLQVLFITVDPARDTTDVLRAYAMAIHPRILGLTGSEQVIAAAARAYRVHRRVFRMDGAAGPDDYLVDHSSLTYLMGQDGQFVTLFPHGSSPERIAAVLRKYLGGTG